MRKIFEWIGGFALIAFSFYFTDKVSLLVANKSELMQEIKEVSAEYETKPVDAKIDVSNNTIIPGKFGKKINSEESYISMHDFGSFNETYLVYDYVKPEYSLEDHKDKFITSGNPENRQVSIIVENNTEIETYLNEKKIMYDKLVDSYIEASANVELINAASTQDKFSSLDSKLKNKTRICIKNESLIESCIKKKYYLIDPGIKLDNTHISEFKNRLSPGSIILISSGVKVENLKSLLQEIEFKDFDVVFISKLIDEKERP